MVASAIAKYNYSEVGTRGSEKPLKALLQPRKSLSGASRVTPPEAQLNYAELEWMKGWQGSDCSKSVMTVW